MNRIAYAYAMEGCNAYPQSATGKMVESDPAENLLGQLVEDRYNYDDDDMLEGLDSMERAVQASQWRSMYDAQLNVAERAAMRVHYGNSSAVIAKACDTLGQLISISGRSEHYVATECWIVAKKAEDADGQVLKIIERLQDDAFKQLKC